MSRQCGPDVFAILVLALATPALAQQSGLSGGEPLQHIAADAMSAADRAAVESHQGELAVTAKIYGYSFEAENWSYAQTVCPPMPESILLHYRQIFPDGTESLFTALIPRGAGRVHVVPVLYHNATPFVPAPRNPSSYALFNQEVPEEIARQDTSANGDWLVLSACYAEMTGGHIHIPPNGKVDIGVATAPLPMNHIEIQDKTIRVTFADRESDAKYRVWSILFNRNGRVKSATTDIRPVYPEKNTSQSRPIAASGTPRPNQPGESGEATTAASSRPQQPAAAITNPVSPTRVESRAGSKPSASGSVSSSPAPSPSAGASDVLAGVSSETSETTAEPGWRLVMHPKQAPSKIIPPGPPPPEMIKPEPPDPTAQPSSQPQ